MAHCTHITAQNANAAPHSHTLGNGRSEWMAIVARMNIYIAFVNGIGTNSSHRNASLAPLAFARCTKDANSITIAAAANTPTVIVGFIISEFIVSFPFLFPPVFYHFPRRRWGRRRSLQPIWPQKTSMQIAGAFFEVEKPSRKLQGHFPGLKNLLANCRGLFQGRKPLLQNAWAFSKPG